MAVKLFEGGYVLVNLAFLFYWFVVVYYCANAMLCMCASPTSFVAYGHMKLHVCNNKEMVLNYRKVLVHCSFTHPRICW